MTLTKDMAGLAVGMGSLALVKQSSKLATDKKMTPKKLTKGLVDLTIGTSLLVPTSKIVNELA